MVLPPLRSSFSLLLPRPPTSSLFPYTTLFRSQLPARDEARAGNVAAVVLTRLPDVDQGERGLALEQALDRKSTRLNSSHITISYAVFCLKKKKTISTRFRASPILPSAYPTRYR